MMSAPDAETTKCVLDLMAVDGADMTQLMEVEFFLMADIEEAASSIARSAEKIGFATRIVVDREQDKGVFTCHCTKILAPSFANVWAAEKELCDIAHKAGGWVDGFELIRND